MVLVTLFLANLSAEDLPRTFQDGLAAKVNDKVVLWSECRRLVQGQLDQLEEHRGQLSTIEYAKQLQTIVEAARDEMIDRLLILDEFEASGAQFRPLFVQSEIDRMLRENFSGDRKQFTAELIKSGLTEIQLRQEIQDRMIVQHMRQANAAKPLFLTPAELKQSYEANKAIFAEGGSVIVRTITIPKAIPGQPETMQRQLAVSVHQQLSDGSDFGLMAQTYSIDSDATRGGLRPQMSPGDLGTNLSKTAFTLPLGELSQVLEEEYGFVIMKVEEREEPRFPSLDEIRPQIERLTLMQKRRDAVEEWLAKLRRNGNVTRFTLAG